MTWPHVVGQRPDKDGGRGPQVDALLLLRRGLMQAAGAGHEVGSFDAAGGMATCGWPES